MLKEKVAHWCSGIPRIIGKVRAAGLKKPEFYKLMAADQSVKGKAIGKARKLVFAGLLKEKKG